MDYFGYALGVALTDASVFIHKQTGRSYKRTGEVRRDEGGAEIKRAYTRYRISLQCKDELFIRRFSEALTALTGKPARYRALERKFKEASLPGMKDGHVFCGFQITVIHKATAARLMAERDKVRSLDLGDYSEDTLRSMLVAFVDADGYLSPKNGNILIRQKDPSFMVAVCDLLGVPYRVSNYAGQTASEIYIPKAAAASIDTFKRP